MTTYKLKLRWPVHQIDEKEIVVEVPTDPMATPLIIVNLDVAKRLNLSDAEFDKAADAANHAAIKSILIIE